MEQPISACFTFVQLRGQDTFIRGTLGYQHDGQEARQEWAFRVPGLEEAEDALQWMQMALARACDGV